MISIQIVYFLIKENFNENI